jgi:hypothetical protein
MRQWGLVLLLASSSPATRPAELQTAKTGQRPAIQDLNTPRAFPRIASRKEWEQRAKEIREQVLVSCGLWPLPEKTPLQAHIFGKVERDGYSVEKVYFQSLPGFYLAGNLYRPPGRGPFPGVLNPHGHWKEGRLADNKDGSVPARCISFARQGMVAFSYDMVGFNDTRFADSPTNRPFYELHRQFGTNQTDLLWNISLMGLQTWNSIRALDFLAALPGVDRKRLAITGASGGGTQTFMLGAVDDRLAAQAPVVMVSHTMQGGCSCENAPGLRVEYSNMEIAAAAAPRPQLLVGATGDWTKSTLTVEGPAIEHIYQLFNAQDKFRYVRFDFGHNYNRTSREAVYDWFGRWLPKHPDPASLKEAPYLKEADADLRVFAGGKLPEDAKTRAQLTDSLKALDALQWQALIPRDKRGLARFKSVMLPAWQHTLQLNWPPSIPHVHRDSSTLLNGVGSCGFTFRPEPGGRGASALYESYSTNSPRSIVVVAYATGPQGWLTERQTSNDQSRLTGLAERLRQSKSSFMTIGVLPIEQPQDPFANFFTTYNRTRIQEQVGNLAGACAFARGVLKANRVILCGVGRAGLWALLAAPAADAVVADCDRLDTSCDEVLLAPDLFCPGIRRLGTFEGGPMLAAPHPLLLHNTGANFATEALRSVYQAAGASHKLQVESSPLADEDLEKWISRLQ